MFIFSVVSSRSVAGFLEPNGVVSHIFSVLWVCFLHVALGYQFLESLRVHGPEAFLPRVFEEEIVL